MRITEHTQLFQPPESVHHDISFRVSDADAQIGWLAYCRKCQRRFNEAIEWVASECNA